MLSGNALIVNYRSTRTRSPLLPPPRPQRPYPIAAAASSVSSSVPIASTSPNKPSSTNGVPSAFSLFLARRLDAWYNLHATTGVCRGYMRDVQHGRLGEGRYLLVVPVDEDMTRGGENIGGATLRERNDFFLSFGGEKGEFEETSCSQCEHGQKFERRGERGKVIDLYQSFGLHPCKNLLNWWQS